MATRRISVLNGHSKADTSGKVWAEPAAILGTSDAFDYLIWRIDETPDNDTALTTRVGFYGQFNVPKGYVGAPVIIFVWRSTKTTGAVVFDFDYRAVGGSDAESLDQAGVQEATTVTATAGSAAHERMESSLPLTAANIAADDTVQFFAGNDGGDSGDTLAGARIIEDVLFQYSDS